MRMSRERMFSLADRILDDLLASEGISVKGIADEKVRGHLRTEVFRVLEDESKLEESIDQEVRRTLASYSRPMPEGSAEWEVLYRKTREEIQRRRFRLSSLPSFPTPPPPRSRARMRRPGAADRAF